MSLDNVDSEKLLGVNVDKYLTWKHHVDKTAKIISKNIALLHSIKRYLPHQTRLSFYKTHIQSHLDYCNIIWSLSTHVPSMFTLQKMVLRIIMNVPKLAHSAPLFNECEIMTIQKRVKFRTITLVYKSLNGLISIYMANMFQKVANVSTRNTRSSQSNMLYVPKSDVCNSRRSLSYNGVILYNTLNSKIQECDSLGAFKYKVFKSLM